MNTLNMHPKSILQANTMGISHELMESCTCRTYKPTLQGPKITFL